MQLKNSELSMMSAV